MKQILINGLQYAKRGAGISRYTFKLAGHMYDDVDAVVQENVSNDFSKKNNIKICRKNVNSSKGRIITEQLSLLSLYKQYDLVHFPDYATPILYRGKKVATIHDMAMFTMKDKYTKSQVITKRFFMDRTIKTADKLICISEFTAKELKKYYPNIDDKKIEVIYNGFDYTQVNLTEKEKQSTLQKFNINSKYLLYVGTIAPHKNIDRLIEAFKNLKEKGYKHQLVIAGKKGWMYNEVFEKVKELNLEDFVVFTDYISDKELEVLYQEADVFTFPSLYEGFGFPPIEAMARKVPVVSSGEGALLEVVGNAALICNPYDVNDISNKIEEVINNEELRLDLIFKGIDRYKYFSWEKTCKQTYEVYKSVLRGE